MNELRTMAAWCQAKFGRIVTFCGGLFASIDVFDITPIKEPLHQFLGDRGIAGAALLCFFLSWARHQYVASKVAPKPDVLPPPVAQPK